MQKSARSNAQIVVEIITGNGQIMVEMAPTMQAKAHPFRRGASN